MFSEDSDLVLRLQNGDFSAFDELFDKYKRKAVGTAYLITGNLFSSEDIVQEAFIICYTKIKSLKNPQLFKPWFFKIVTRLSWKSSNNDKKVTPVEDIFEQSETKADNYFDIVKKEEYEELYRSINLLDKKSKTTVILFYFNDFSIKEIAKIMGCLQGTVKSRLFNSRKKLKKFLDDFSKERDNNEVYI